MDNLSVLSVVPATLCHNSCYIPIFWHSKPAVFPQYFRGIFRSILRTIPKRNHHEICYAEMAFMQHVIVFLGKEFGRTF